MLLAAPALPQDAAGTWRGLMVAPENRCSPYDRKRDYPYPQSIEQDIVRGLGRVYGPYTDTCFASARETDIEHIVAASEAHELGPLRQGPCEARARFASDLRNLTLASPRVNRHRKSAKDAAEWLPERNRCWFAARVVEVRRAYGLTIDRREAMALERILAQLRRHRHETGNMYGRANRGRKTGTNAPATAMPWPCTTTTATAGSPARRPGGTASRPCPEDTRPTGTCGMATATGSSVSEPRPTTAAVPIQRHRPAAGSRA